MDGFPIGGFRIGGNMQMETALSGAGFREVFLNIFILNGTDELIQAFCLFRGRRDGHDFVMLGEKDRERKTDIADTGDGNPIRALDGNPRRRIVIFQQIRDLKTENGRKLFKLLNRRHVLAVFQVAEDGAVDSGFSGELCLGKTEPVPAGANCIGQELFG